MRRYKHENSALASIKESVSVNRLATYRRLVGKSVDSDVFDLYILNARLSGAFLLPIQAVEVTLRNRCDNILTASFGADWMTNGSVDLTRWQREQGQLNIYAIPSYTPDAYQFGFWQSFFASGHYLLWESLLHRIFVNRPKRFTRSLVIDKLERIRLFRNRIAHHEQIISHDPLVRYADMRDLITWLDPAQAAWLDHYCQVPGVWKEIQEQQADRGWVGF